MVDNPSFYIPKMKEQGADYVSFHCDSTSFVRGTLFEISEAGMKAGIVLNPSQSVDVIRPYAQYLDYIVFMSVEPGFAGQKFLEGSMERLRDLALLRRELGLNFQIIVDGGVHYGIIEECVKNGADALVTNVYTIFNQPEGITAACRRFTETMKNVVCEI